MCSGNSGVLMLKLNMKLSSISVLCIFILVSGCCVISLCMLKVSDLLLRDRFRIVSRIVSDLVNV